MKIDTRGLEILIELREFSVTLFIFAPPAIRLSLRANGAEDHTSSSINETN
jgi:hypothetical protein